MCDDREERLGGEHLRIVPSKAEFMLFRDLCAPQMCAAASSSLNIQTHFLLFFLLFPFPHGVLTDQLLGEVNYLRSVFFCCRSDGSLCFTLRSLLFLPCNILSFFVLTFVTGFHLPPSVLSGKMLKHAHSSSSSSSVLSFCLLIIFYSMINICLCHFSTSVYANPLERCSYLFNSVSVVSITIFPIPYLVALERSQSLCAIMVKSLCAYHQRTVFFSQQNRAKQIIFALEL